MADEEKMRLTMHNARKGSYGDTKKAFSTKHNDRNYDYSNDDHIDPEKTPDNINWHCFMGVEKDLTFDQVEAVFYEAHFEEHLERANLKHLMTRHPQNVKTIEDYRRSTQTCPEETEFMIGKQGDDVDPYELARLVADYIDWEQQTYPNIRTLNFALHVDERGQAHVHQRKVWIAHDENGCEMVGQAKALEEMGVERPKPNKKRSKWNNEKQVFSAIARNKMFELCKAAGYDLEEEPREASESGLTLLEYKRRQEEKKLKALEQRESDLEAQISDLEKKQKEYAENQRKAEEDAKKALKEREDEFEEELKEKKKQFDTQMELERANYKTMQEAKEKEFQAKEDKLEAQKKAFEEEKTKWETEKTDIEQFKNKANKEIREEYEKAYGKAVDACKYAELEQDNRSMGNLINAIVKSGMTYHGQPIINHFKRLAGATPTEQIKQPVRRTPPQYRGLSSMKQNQNEGNDTPAYW